MDRVGDSFQSSQSVGPLASSSTTYLGSKTPRSRLRFRLPLLSIHPPQRHCTVCTSNFPMATTYAQAFVVLPPSAKSRGSYRDGPVSDVRTHGAVRALGDHPAKNTYVPLPHHVEENNINRIPIIYRNSYKPQESSALMPYTSRYGPQLGGEHVSY